MTPVFFFNTMMFTMLLASLTLSEWFKVNKLSLNVSQSNFMIFSPLQCNVDTIDIFIDGGKINAVANAKFLGIYLSYHTHYLWSNICKIIGILCKIRYLCHPVLLNHYMIHLSTPNCPTVILSFPSYLDRLHIYSKRKLFDQLRTLIISLKAKPGSHI